MASIYENESGVTRRRIARIVQDPGAQEWELNMHGPIRRTEVVYDVKANPSPSAVGIREIIDGKS